MYIAGRLLKISGEARMPGDPVPEAAQFKNLHSYLNTGHVLQIEKGSSFEELPPWVKTRIARGRMREKLEGNGVLSGGVSVVQPPKPSEDITQPIEPTQPDEDEYACGECDRTFATKRGLRTHKRSSH